MKIFLIGLDVPCAMLMQNIILAIDIDERRIGSLYAHMLIKVSVSIFETLTFV